MTVAGEYVTTYDYNGNQIYKAKGLLEPLDSQSEENIGIYVAGQENIPFEIVLNEHDGFNQLVNTITGDKTITYAYKGDGLRIFKTVNGITTKHIWDGNQIVMELDRTGTITAKYIRGINLIYSQDDTETKGFYLFNGNGDVVQLTGIDGIVIKIYDYDAFGVEKNRDAADTNPFRYCGEYFDKETGTIYLRARYYAPGIGRFISEDSYKGKDNDPLSLNLYTYAHKNQSCL